MTLENFGNLNISQFIYQKRNEIPILNTVKITDYNWGRIDIIISQFCGNRIEYLPLLLDFNKIQNPFEIPIGKYIDIPDFDFIILNCKSFDIESEKIPGVNQSMDCKKVNRNLSVIINNIVESAPKLGALKKVTYNPDTGIIKF